MPQVSLDALMKSLRAVHHPELPKDPVSLGLIRDVRLGEDGTVSLAVQMGSQAPQLKAQVLELVKRAVQATPGVTSVQVSLEQPGASHGPGAQSGPKPGTAGGQSIEGVKHIIAVSSGKGGVGKSTVAVNLATSLALDGHRVGLMDADVYGPNVPTMMGVTDEPRIENHPTEGERFLPPSSHGVKVMSMGFLIRGDQPLVWRGPMLHNVVSQFCHKVNWGELDYLVVDMPPGTGDVQLSLAQLVPVSGAVLVSTPQEVSMQDVRKAHSMFEKVRIPLLGFVENMSWFQCSGCSERHYLFGQDGGKTLAKKFGAELLAQLPIQPAVRQGGDEGTPIVVRDPKSEVAQAFRDLARRVAGRVRELDQARTSGAAGISIGRFE